MTNIIITAGGTTEAIDGVRKITNTSTGRLSACIYEALAEFIEGNSARRGEEGWRDRNFTVHYVMASSAVLPKIVDRLPIIFYQVTDVKSVEEILKELMSVYTFDYVIHGMAVSDFTKGYLIEREQLANELAGTIIETFYGEKKERSLEELKRIINQVIENPVHALESNVKVSSKSELILSLVKTPKLIEKIKIWNPKAYLVGFKLLKGASEEQLIQAGTDLANKSGCNLVLVNDMSKISEYKHHGLLIQNGKVVGEYSNKEAIARGIVEHMINEQ